MKKLVLTSFSILMLALSVSAQTDQTVKDAAKPQEVKIVEDSAHHWKKGGFLGVNFGQSALFNWAAGGQNTITVQLNANGFINYAKGHMAWDNSMNFALGGIVQGHVLKTPAGTRPAAFRKNVDQLQLTSRLGYIIDKKKQWMGAFLADYKTSVLNGYDYSGYDADPTVANPQRIASPFSPSYVILSVGINYKPKPYVSFYLSPIAGKLSFVNAGTTSFANAKTNLDSSLVVDQTRYGFKKTETFRHQLGAYLRADFQKDIVKNVNLKTTLELFTPYTNETIPNAEDSATTKLPSTISTVGKIDVNWLTGLNFKVNKYITCSLEWQLIYSYTTLVPRFSYSDGTITKRYNSVQFREGLTIGFGYKF